MLSKRLRRRLRQIDESARSRSRDPECDDAPSEDAADREPVRVGVAGLSRRRLCRERSEIDSGRQLSSTAQTGSRGPASARYPEGPLEQLAPGEVVESPEGSYWLVESPACEMLPHGHEILTRFELITRSSPVGAAEDLAALCGVRPSELVLLDTETGGLSSAPVFLVGLIVWESDRAGDAVSVQMLARDYAEERAVLAASAELLRGRRVLMTYNGKSFDLPLMRERMIYHGLGECPEPQMHLDLLHAIRARFRDRWENCRLLTVEKALCGRSRWDDIDGAEIPDAWHEFVHSGDAGRIARVLEHNRLDLITMLEALPHLQGSGAGR